MHSQLRGAFSSPDPEPDPEEQPLLLVVTRRGRKLALEMRSAFKSYGSADCFAAALRVL
jgi:hypothetical protein